MRKTKYYKIANLKFFFFTLPIYYFRTLQWIRRDAPIIIHLKLDRVLKFLVDDTHYRNLFETHTGSGSLDKTARSSWEVREGRGSEGRSV